MKDSLKAFFRWMNSPTMPLWSFTAMVAALFVWISVRGGQS